MIEMDVRRLLSSFARLSKQWGLGESVGKIWGFLLFEGRPLSQRQIEENINFSRGLISRSLAKLSDLGIIEKFKKGRESYYSTDISLLSGFDRVIEDFLRTEIEPAITYLSKNLNRVEDETTKTKIRRMIDEYETLVLGIQVFSGIMKKYSSSDTRGLTQAKIIKILETHFKNHQAKTNGG
ncbi:MAG: ArsR family transcriptional regulator [Theionarchaea archaeon]|nr:ArsR family transcriptional regulator [Theionarchaea archaeon]